MFTYAPFLQETHDKPGNPNWYEMLDTSQWDLKTTLVAAVQLSQVSPNFLFVKPHCTHTHKYIVPSLTSR